MSTFEELLEQDGRIVYKTKGSSMRPLLHENRDLVVILKKDGRLRRYDVALYRRGTAYVLHRVVGVRDEGYLIRGDNTYALEMVPDSAVIGVLTGFQRKGKMYTLENRGYQCYIRFWQLIYPVRFFYVRLIRLAVFVLRKTGIPLRRKRSTGQKKGGRG